MSIVHQPGEIIQGKYRITGILGRGGVAVTYRAIALAANPPALKDTATHVAIKVISLKQLDNWKQVELFQREAEILKQLDHPNIADYIDYFDIETKTDKAFYLVQQLAPGKSLSQLVETGWRTNEQEVRNIAQQVLTILSYLHSLDPPVIHRDIKPHNLIRDDKGKIYLVDFGAVQNTYYNTLMQGSTVVGTYGYMAPEQFRGQALPATDLYSLGATLLYLLTHRSPAELPQDTLKLDFRSAVDISESFAEWLEKILEPDLEDRFDSADIALAELFAVERKKHKRLLTNISIGILLLGLITGFNSYKWFFLSRFGFFPSKLCYSHVMNDFVKQKGNINHIARQQRTSVFSCIVKTGDKQRIKQAISSFNHAEKEINYPDSVNSNSHKKPLHYAIFGNKYEVIKLLLDNGADPNATNKYGRSPFYDAAHRSHITVFQLLIDRGADVNTKDVDGITPLFSASYWNDEDKIRLLIKHGADVDARDRYGKTALFYSIANKNINIAKLLIDNGADINAKDRNGNTVLFADPIGQKIPGGMRRNNDANVNVVKFFIDRGADVNHKNNAKETPLSTWRKRQNKDVAGLLAKYDASDRYDLENISLFDAVAKNQVESVLDIVQRTDVNIKDSSQRTPLFGSAYNGNARIVKILIDWNADIDVMDVNRQTPLSLAVEQGNEEVVALLLKHNADVNIRDNSGKTPLFYASSRGHKNIAQMLINHKNNINLRNNHGQTSLFGAAYHGNLELIRLLIDNGAEINIKDKYGVTPLFNAIVGGNEEAARLLVAEGADASVELNGITALELFQDNFNKSIY